MSVTLMFQRPPFLPQTRTVWTPNNNFLVLDQVTMSREEAQLPKCDIRSVVSPYPLVLPYPLPRYTASCEEKGPAVPELQVWKDAGFFKGTVHQTLFTPITKQMSCTRNSSQRLIAAKRESGSLLLDDESCLSGGSSEP